MVDEFKPLEFISSGSPQIDTICGGGYPRGRIIELFGWESSGKSTLAVAHAIEQQKKGKCVVYLDYERVFPPEYYHSLGLKGIKPVDRDKLIVLTPETVEDGIAIAEDLMEDKSSNIGLIIFDSVSAMMTVKQAEAEVEDATKEQPGQLAKMLSNRLRHLVGRADKAKCTLVFINQLRSNLKAMNAYAGGGEPDWTTSGGNGLKFYASIRIMVERKGEDTIAVKNPVTKKDDKIHQGYNARVTTIKNKVAPGKKRCEIYFKDGSGIDTKTSVWISAVGLGIIEKQGAGWYEFKSSDPKAAFRERGEEHVKEFVLSNDYIFAAIDEALRANISSTTVSDDEIMASAMVSQSDLTEETTEDAQDEIGDAS